MTDVNILESIDPVPERRARRDRRLQPTPQEMQHQAAIMMLTRLDHSDLEVSLKNITEVASDTLDVERVSIWLYNEDHSAIICHDLYSAANDQHNKGDVLKAADYPHYFSALEESRIIAAVDACTDARTAEFSASYLKPLGISSMLDVPIRLRGQLAGVLCHEHSGLARNWTHDEERFATSLADLVTLAIETDERRQAEAALRESEARKAAMFMAALDGIITVDHEGRILEFNPAAERIFGCSAADALGRDVADLLLLPEIKDQHRAGFARYLATEKASILGQRVEVTARRVGASGVGTAKGGHAGTGHAGGEGEAFFAELTITRIPTQNTHTGKPIFIGYVRDITQRKKAERLLEVRHTVTEILAQATTLEGAAPTILEAIGNTVGWDYGVLWKVSNNRQALHCVSTWHREWATFNEFDHVNWQVSFAPGEGLAGQVWADRKPIWITDFTTRNSSAETVSTEVGSDEVSHVGASVSDHPESTTGSASRAPVAAKEDLHGAFGFPIRLGDEVLGVIEYFSSQIQVADPDLLAMMDMLGSQIGQFIERKRAEEQLVHNAYHDALTGLPNRPFFMERLERALARSHQQPEYRLAVLFLDFDHFKIVNDSLGHMVGDQMLIELAQRLEKCVKSSDTIARWGGDEFTILLEGIASNDAASQVAERVQNCLSEPFVLNDQPMFSAVSIGIALSEVGGYERPEEMLRDADTAMYRAKSTGRARYEMFDNAMHAQALRRLQLESDLRRALEKDELELQYQPIVSLQTGHLRSFEALIRWRHPQLGLMSPLEFVPVAEETGLIMRLDAWALRTACLQMQQWQQQFARHMDEKLTLNISVNLSSRHFSRPDLVEQVAQVLRTTGIEASCVKLEITESALMENAEYAAELLQRLRALGCRLSLDDFGTGYSSLSYLHRFPFNTLKVDRSFVMRMDESNEALEIVRAIITMAHSLGIDVIAEGVETASQVQQLQDLQCEYGQGYYFDRPLESNAAEVWLAPGK